jgi:hypothetical protein
MSKVIPRYWPSARHFTEAIQCPGVCFSDRLLRETQPAVDRLGMPLVTSGQFAYVYKLKSGNGGDDFAVRCFRGYLGDRDQRYRAIQAHIQTHQLPFLSGFTYAPEGILVGGNRFPTIFMKWIEGPTLDLYLDEMIGRREVLLHLTREWVKLVGMLRKADIAHGDLQHGNVIIEQGSLRLIDHDGMFVPAMAGWCASELGHQHYQHPRRDAELFDSTLDNFSSLVIYLSLISLTEQPSLWPEHHDENLLFTKTDFVDPASSDLFAKIKKLGPEHRRLADILEGATTGEPKAVPYLLDLVSVRSSLPMWMTAPPNVESRAKTREVIQTEPAVQGPLWKPWQARPATSSLPATPPSSTVQTIFGGPPPSTMIPGIRDPSRVLRNTPVFAKELFTKSFLWWYWGVYLCLMVFGVDVLYSLLVTFTLLTTVGLVYGFIRAREAAQVASQTNSPFANSLPSASSSSPQFSSPSMSLSKLTAYQLPPTSITANDPIIANRVLSIYHLRDCSWVGLISDKNRVSFMSPSEALSHGFKPCKVCSPLN